MADKNRYWNLPTISKNRAPTHTSLQMPPTNNLQNQSQVDICNVLILTINRHKTDQSSQEKAKIKILIIFKIDINHSRLTIATINRITQYFIKEKRQQSLVQYRQLK